MRRTRSVFFGKFHDVFCDRYFLREVLEVRVQHTELIT